MQQARQQIDDLPLELAKHVPLPEAEEAYYHPENENENEPNLMAELAELRTRHDALLTRLHDAEAELVRLDSVKRQAKPTSTWLHTCRIRYSPYGTAYAISSPRRPTRR